MSFKTIKIVGDGTQQSVITTGIDTEAVTTGVVVYNNSAASKDFDVIIDNIIIMRENIEAGGNFRLKEKINVESGRVLKLNLPTDVDATVMYFQQPISDIAALNTLQRLVAEAQDHANEAQGYVGDAEQFALEAKQYRNTYTVNGLLDTDVPTPADSQALVYDSNVGKWVGRNIVTIGQYNALAARVLVLENK